MPHKECIFFFAIMLMGFLDWLTTVTGIAFFGATEANPLLSGVARSNMVIFSAAKLTAVVIAGFAFYKAASISRKIAQSQHFTNGFLNGGCSLTVLGLAAVVANNIAVILGP